MIVKLIAKHNGRRTVIPLRLTSVAVLGRSHGNAVRIPSAEVSRQHCCLRSKDGVVTVEDMDSVNGTFLNGERLKSAQVVQPGDQIEVGPVKFTVEYELSSQARSKLKGNEDSSELLAGLVDGDVMDVDPVEEDLPELEVIDTKPRRAVEKKPPEPAPAADPLGSIENEFDFEATPWNMPEGGDLRDLLLELEDEPARPAKGKKPRGQ